jgi:hypothetical protein
MSGMSQSMARAIEDAIYNAVPLSWTQAYVRLMTTASTATTEGTEVTGGSYARAAVGMGSPSGNSIASDALLTFANMPDCTGANTIKGVDVVNAASGTATQWLYIDGLSISVTAGENKTIDVGALTTQGT